MTWSAHDMSDVLKISLDESNKTINVLELYAYVKTKWDIRVDSSAIDCD